MPPCLFETNARARLAIFGIVVPIGSWRLWTPARKPRLRAVTVPAKPEEVDAAQLVDHIAAGLFDLSSRQIAPLATRGEEGVPRCRLDTSADQLVEQNALVLISKCAGTKLHHRSYRGRYVESGRSSG